MIKAGQVRKSEDKVKLPRAGAMSKSQQVRSLQERLEGALRDSGKLPKPKEGEYYAPGYVADVYDKTVVFSDKTGELYAVSFAEKDGKIELGDAIAVERVTSYVPKS